MTEPEAPTLCFKIASEDWEFQQIHQLNYQTFVEEIPQHPACAERLLVDRFHSENVYAIALRGRRLLGMLALRGQRPFSLDGKLPDLDHYLPTSRQVCEVRLLATTKCSRNGVVFRGLVNLLVERAIDTGYELAIISGTTRQAKLYHHMGFVPFGPLVGAGEAVYQPMYLTLDTFRQRGKAFRALRTIPPQRGDEPPVPGAVRRDV